MGVAGHLHLYLVVSLSVYNTRYTDAADYCFSDVFSASCNGTNEVIMMRSASYGRMKAGLCISGQFGYLGCTTDVLPTMDTLCSGQQRCKVAVARLDRMATACSADFKSYLEADYDCVQVDDFCSNSVSRVPLTGNQGYISLSSSSHMVILKGQSNCTLSILASLGQQIQLKMYDFSRAGTTGNGLRVEDSACPVTITIKESNENNIKTVVPCSLEGSRNRIIATSDSSSMSLSVNVNERSMPHFLLRYEVVGCADRAMARYTTQMRTEDTMTVTCNNTGESWHLVCFGTVWLGQVGNCTDVDRLSELAAEVSVWAFPNGIVTVISLGVGIGLVLGFGLLAVLYVCRIRCIQKVPDRPAFASNKLSEIQIPYPNVSDPRSLTQRTVSMSPASLGGQWVHAQLPQPCVEKTTAVVHVSGQRTEALESATGRAFTVTRIPLKDHIYDTVRQGQ